MANLPEKVSEDTLCLLYSLFISNVPQSVKEEWEANIIRIFAELEWAHWFYLDNCLKDSQQAGVDFFGFCQQMFERFPYLMPKKFQWKEKFFEWKRYRGATSSGSAIILDECFSMVLLVQGFAKSTDRWTFPGGKVNQNETLKQCAIREVMEETGLDIEHRLDLNLFLDTKTGETRRRAYIIEGFPRTTRLQPSTTNEIEAITWFNLNNLPDSLQDETSMKTMNLRPSFFFYVVPFVKQLRSYVKLRREGCAPAEALARSARSQSAASEHLGCPTVASSPNLLPLSAFSSTARALSNDRLTNETRKQNAARKISAKPPATVQQGQSQFPDVQRGDVRNSQPIASSAPNQVPSISSALPPFPNAAASVTQPNRAPPKNARTPSKNASAPSAQSVCQQLNKQLTILRMLNPDESSIWGGTVSLNPGAFLNMLAPVPTL